MSLEHPLLLLPASFPIFSLLWVVKVLTQYSEHCSEEMGSSTAFSKALPFPRSRGLCRPGSAPHCATLKKGQCWQSSYLVQCIQTCILFYYYYCLLQESTEISCLKTWTSTKAVSLWVSAQVSILQVPPTTEERGWSWFTGSCWVHSLQHGLSACYQLAARPVCLSCGGGQALPGSGSCSFYRSSFCVGMDAEF